MSRTRRVVLLVESTTAYGRRLLQGISDYANTYGPWTFFHAERSTVDPVPGELKKWKPEGVIARIHTQKLAGQLRYLKVPIVDLYEQGFLKKAFRVLDNDQAVVRLAAAHLRDCGLQNFGYVGYPGAQFSEQRWQHFARILKEYGFSPYVFRSDKRSSRHVLADLMVDARRETPRLSKWLRDLPKPIGILTCNDMRAWGVLTACADVGIRVPDEIALMGIDNDDVLCDLCNPSLSSVEPNPRKVGYEAAALLSRLIAGSKGSPKTVFVEPLRC